MIKLIRSYRVLVILIILAFLEFIFAQNPYAILVSNVLIAFLLDRIQKKSDSNEEKLKKMKELIDGKSLVVGDKGLQVHSVDGGTF